MSVPQPRAESSNGSGANYDASTTGTRPTSRRLGGNTAQEWLRVRMAGTFDAALSAIDAAVPSCSLDRYFAHETAGTGAPANSSDTPWGLVVLWRHGSFSEPAVIEGGRRSSFILARPRSTTPVLDGSQRAITPSRGILWEGSGGRTELAVDTSRTMFPHEFATKFADEEKSISDDVLRLLQHLSADGTVLLSSEPRWAALASNQNPFRDR